MSTHIPKSLTGRLQTATPNLSNPPRTMQEGLEIARAYRAGFALGRELLTSLGRLLEEGDVSEQNLRRIVDEAEFRYASEVERMPDSPTQQEDTPGDEEEEVETLPYEGWEPPPGGPILQQRYSRGYEGWYVRNREGWWFLDLRDIASDRFADLTISSERWTHCWGGPL